MKRITKEDREIIAKTCPKFNRICACYCNNPEYGVTLSPKAKRALNAGKNSVKSKAKSKVLSVRLTLEEMDRVEKHLLETSKSISEYIKEKITDDVT